MIALHGVVLLSRVPPAGCRGRVHVRPSPVRATWVVIPYFSGRGAGALPAGELRFALLRMRFIPITSPRDAHGARARARRALPGLTTLAPAAAARSWCAASRAQARPLSSRHSSTSGCAMNACCGALVTRCRRRGRSGRSTTSHTDLAPDQTCWAIANSRTTSSPPSTTTYAQRRRSSCSTISTGPTRAPSTFCDSWCVASRKRGC